MENKEPNYDQEIERRKKQKKKNLCVKNDYVWSVTESTFSVVLKTYGTWEIYYMELLLSQRKRLKRLVNCFTCRLLPNTFTKK